MKCRYVALNKKDVSSEGFKYQTKRCDTAKDGIVLVAVAAYLYYLLPLNPYATGLNFTYHLIILTLRLLISYIYGAPSKARNANVVYIWTYVWQR